MFTKCSSQVLIVLIAVAVPHIGPFVSLLGAVCLSTLGLMFPAVIDLVVCWEDPGLGRYNWRLISNVLFIVFGIVAFVLGSFVSVLDIINTIYADTSINE